MLKISSTKGFCRRFFQNCIKVLLEHHNRYLAIFLGEVSSFAPRPRIYLKSSIQKKLFMSVQFKIFWPVERSFAPPILTKVTRQKQSRGVVQSEASDDSC